MRIGLCSYCSYHTKRKHLNQNTNLNKPAAKAVIVSRREPIRAHHNSLRRYHICATFPPIYGGFQVDCFWRNARLSAIWVLPGKRNLYWCYSVHFQISCDTYFRFSLSLADWCCSPYWVLETFQWTNTWRNVNHPLIWVEVNNTQQNPCSTSRSRGQVVFKLSSRHLVFSCVIVYIYFFFVKCIEDLYFFPRYSNSNVIIMKAIL